MTTEIGLLILSALLTVGVVEPLARHWQSRQKQMELKPLLVADVSDCVMRFVTDLRRLRSAYRNAGSDQDRHSPSAVNTNVESIQRRLTDAQRDFDVGRCVVGTKLEAYYPGVQRGVVGDPDLHDQWNIFAEYLLKLSEFARHPGKDTLTDTLRDRRAGHAGQVVSDRASRRLVNPDDIRSLSKLKAELEFYYVKGAPENGTPHDAELDHWETSETLLLAEKSRLIDCILEERMPRFTWRPWWQRSQTNPDQVVSAGPTGAYLARG